MASTNKTTHYELSQYIGTDKPTYLTDYNQDMDKIDTGIYGAKSLADINNTAIGNLTNLTTSVKTDLVSAVNEVNGKADGIGTLSSLTTTDKTSLVGAVNEVNGKADNIGTLANLTTTDKASVVVAINEVNSNVGTLANLTTTNKSSSVVAINEVNSNVGTLANLTTTDKTSTVGAINEVKNIIENFNLNNFLNITNITLDNPGSILNSNITVATNNDKSLAKIYGVITFQPNNTGTYTVTIHNSGLTPSTDITINNCGLYRFTNSQGNYIPSSFDINIKTNGDIEITKNVTANIQQTFFLFPMLYFIKDFGDTPLPQ